MCTAPRYLLYSHHNHNKTGRLQSKTKHSHTHTHTPHTQTNTATHTHKYLHLHRVCLPSTYIHTYYTHLPNKKNPSRIKIETFTKKESNRRQLRAWCGGVAVPAKLSNRSGSSTVLQSARISSARRVCHTVTNSPAQFGSLLINRCIYRLFSAIACQRCLHTCGHTVVCGFVDGSTKMNENQNENEKKKKRTYTYCVFCV